MQASLGGATAMTPPPDLRDASYLAYRGGELRFGRLTMQDAELTMVSEDAALLGFSPVRPYQQLEDGVTVSTADRGLVSHIADSRKPDHAWSHVQITHGLTHAAVRQSGVALLVILPE